MAEVELRHVSMRFPGVAAMDQISFRVQEGEFVTLLGPSGCGKSTTLNVIAGLLEPSAGDVLIGGKRVNGVAPKARQVAMVFQDYALYPHLTVFENLAFPLQAAKLPKPEIQRKVQAVAERLGLESLLARLPKALSGGQRQRVALGRALVRDPQAFLMDEPLSNLDARLRVAMRSELKQLHRQLGATIIYVTHDQAEAMTLSDRVAVLREGRLQQFGTPREIYEEPANQFVASFMGAMGMNFVPCRVGAAAGNAVLSHGPWRIPLSREQDKLLRDHALDEVVVSFRPEHLALANPGEGGVEMQAVLVEYLGSEQVVHLMLGETRILAKVNPEYHIAPDTTLSFRIDTSRITLFDPRTEARLEK